MTKKKESPKEADMGTKKYKAMQERCNKFYDNHMAGKKNPKTGEFYHDISFKPPTKNLGGRYDGAIECKRKDCDNVMSIKTTTSAIICSKCNLMHSISRNKETGEITIKSSLDDNE